MRKRMLIILVAGLVAASAPAQQAFTLRQAIEYGRAHSPAMAIAANGQRQADAMALEAMSGYLPQVNGSGQFEDNIKRQTTILPAGIFSEHPVPVQFGTQYVTTVNLQAEQTLFDLAQLNGIQASAPNTAMASIRLKQAEEQMAYDVATAYAQAQSHREMARLLQQNLEQYDELVPILRLRMEKGVAQQLDLDRVEVTQRNLRSQLTLAQASYEVAVAQLQRAMGMPLAQAITLADEPGAALAARQPQPGGFDPARLLQHQYNKQTEHLLDIDLRRKRNMRLPVLSAFGRYGAMAQGNDLEKSFDSRYDYATIGLRLNVPLFGGLRRYSWVRQSEIARQDLVEQLRAADLGYELAYRSAATRLLATTTTVDRDAESLRLAEQVFANTNLQYQQGLASLSDLLNADYQLKEARNNWTRSLLDRSVALLDLERAKGTLLEYINTL